MIDYLQGIALNWPPAAVSLILVLVTGGALWLTRNAITRFDDREVLFRDANPGYLAQRSALALAFAVATVPTLTRTDGEHPWYSLIGQAMELGWVFVALLAATFIVDVVVLPKVNNADAMLHGNTAVGIVEAGFYIGLGFILNGSLTGASPTVGQGLASTVVFGTLGLVTLIGVWWLHEAVTPWDVRSGVSQGLLAPAFEVAGVMAAVGIVVREGVAGDFTGWTAGLVAYVSTVVWALATLYLFRWVTNRLILRHFSLKQVQEGRMAGAAAFGAAVAVVVAVSVAAVVRTQL